MIDKNGNENSLAQKFPHLAPDDDLLEIVRWGNDLEAKIDIFGGYIDAWTNAIVSQTKLATQQTDLIASQNLSLQGMTTNYASFGKILLTSKEDLEKLTTELESLTKTIDSQGSTLTNLNDKNQDLQTSLNDKNQDLQTRLNDLSTKLNPLLETFKPTNSLTTDLKTLSTNIGSLKTRSNSNHFLLILFGVLLAVVQSMQLVAFKGVQENLFQTQQRLSWALTKLERLEKR